MTNDIEAQEPLEPVDEEIVETPEAETSHEDLDYDSAIERLKSEEKARKEYEAKMKHWREKAQKLETKKISEAPTDNSSSDIDPTLDKRLSSLEEEKRKRDFGYQHSLSPEETDDVFRFANNGDPKEALENPFVKAGLEARRAQKRAEGAVPSSSNKSTTVKGKTWGDMSAEERKKNFKQVVTDRVIKA